MIIKFFFFFFSEANGEHLRNLRCLFVCFEAVSG